MWQVMCLLHLLLLLFVVCSDQVSAASRSYDPYPRKLIPTGKQSSSNSSSPFRKGFMDPVEVRNGEDNIYHWAMYESHIYDTSVLTGGMATFDVYGLPNLKSRDQMISSAVWVINSERLPDYIVIQAGWTVDPSVYGDTKTHFFTQWTLDDSRSTGCYNLDCDGFVPVNNAPITPGDTLEKINGQLKITIKIFKNKDDGDWWLHFGYDNNNLRPVGFWPKSILSNLAEHANGIMWGGFTQSHAGDASPAMGNGQWPGKNSATVRDIKYVDTNGQGYEPVRWPVGLDSYASHEKCYQVSPFLHDMFYYGGPGGCTE